MDDIELLKKQLNIYRSLLNAASPHQWAVHSKTIDAMEWEITRDDLFEIEKKENNENIDNN